MNKPQSGATNSRNRHGITSINLMSLLGHQSQSERSKFPPYWNESKIQLGLAMGQVVLVSLSSLVWYYLNFIPEIKHFLLILGPNSNQSEEVYRRLH